MSAPASTAPMNFSATSSASQPSPRTPKQRRHGGQRDEDPSSQRPDPAFKRPFLPHSPPSLSLDFGQGRTTRCGMRDLRESKLVAEKNQKWSGRPLCNPNQNTFTFTGCRSQCTGARGVIWIMVRSFAHHLRSPHSLHRCAQTYHPAPTLCLFGFECASAAVYAALCSVTGCMYISQA